MSLSSLCLHCGMCCDGTLFTHVPLQPAEGEALRERGLPVVTREDGGPALPQRCAALDGRTCTVYAARPGACRRYECQLFRALAEGEVSFEEAKGVVDGAHARVEAVARAVAPEGGEETAATVLKRARKGYTDLCSGAREALAHAELYLDRHFRGRFRRSG